MSSEEKYVPLTGYVRMDEEAMRGKVEALRDTLSNRRSIRMFSSDPVPKDIIENAIRAAGTAPSGANHQPWHFVAISDPETKKKIREAAEEEEREFYGGRASNEWLDALDPLGTDAHKPFLETAPWLIAVFAQRRGGEQTGQDKKR